MFKYINELVMLRLTSNDLITPISEDGAEDARIMANTADRQRFRGPCKVRKIVRKHPTIARCNLSDLVLDIRVPIKVSVSYVLNTRL